MPINNFNDVGEPKPDEVDSDDYQHPDNRAQEMEDDESSSSSMDQSESEDSESESDADMESDDGDSDVDVEIDKPERDHPPDIQVEDHVVNVCFHPERNLIALAQISGDISLYSFTNEENKLENQIDVHEAACRDVQFSDDGETLVSVGKDKCIIFTDVKTGKFKRIYEKAHESAIYSLTLLTSNLFATGDDDGTVKIWDTRQSSHQPIFSNKSMEDYVSSMVSNSEKKLLVCASGDGSIVTLNLPSRKLHCQSIEYEEEFTCLNLFKNESKILAGTSSGQMFIFNWGEFGMHSDQLRNLTKKSINCMVPITEQVVVTGDESGSLRAFSVYPNRRLGIAGQHQLSVESVDISAEGELIASSSHDNLVKFWNIKYFEDVDLSKEITRGGKQKQINHHLPSSKTESAQNFFAGLAD